MLYDSSQLAIPTDNVDDSYLMKPSRFKIHFIYRFMAVFGPLSSIFDFLTFFVLAGVFQLTYSAFQTGWFLESIITQTFVVYIIRTRKIPFLQSRPSVALIASTTIAVAIAWIIPFSPIGVWFHLVPLAQTPIIAILCITTTYLLLTEIVKRWFYRKFFLGDKSFG